MTKEKELDLIEISPTAKPPIAKIMDYGKYLYQEKKKAQKASLKVHSTETKAVQIGITTSDHDLQLKAKKIDDFLKEGNRAKIDLKMRGREKYMGFSFHNERIKRLLNFITEEYKIADGPKKGPRGMTMIVEKVK